MSGRVVVVGSVNVDLVVAVERLPGPARPSSAAGSPGTTVARAATRPIAAARLGAPTTFIGAVGDDAFGGEARRRARGRAASTSTGWSTLPGQATGVALIMVDERGENSIAVAGGANAALTSVQVRDGRSSGWR